MFKRKDSQNIVMCLRELHFLVKKKKGETTASCEMQFIV